MINVLSYGIKIWTDLSSVLSGITRVTDRRTDRQTDGRTDRILIARLRLHYMQRGKNEHVQQ